MNKYVLLPMGITGMGGGQMYVRNKMVYMQNKGFKVYVLSCLSGDIYIPELAAYKKYIRNELTCAPFVFSNKFVKKVIDMFLSWIDYNQEDNVILESGTPHMTYWAEIFAQATNGKHLCFLLDERNDLLVQKEYLPFFEFKYLRKELAGITQKSVFQLFQGDKTLEECASLRLKAACQNVTSDIETDIGKSLKEGKTTFGSLGRLDKPYVDYLIDSIVCFAKNNKQNEYNLLLIGGAETKNREKAIKRKTKAANNLNVEITGYIYPIPQKVFDKVDIFISSAGSAGVTYSAGITTISLDGNDGKPIGVLGYTTQSTLYRDTEEIIELKELLDLILHRSYLENYKYVPKERQEYLDIFEEHIDFLNKSNNEKKYFPVLEMDPIAKDSIKKRLVRLLGDKLFLAIKCSFISPIWK